ncbi:MAG TPA: ABC transporter ATP-binding protein, partial [Ilumatobacter sp.]|nr:ABC transporter ATP-binding protein [Ilumatobacter sp.]
MTLAATIGLRRGTLDLQVQIDVAPGELLALLGPNGSGKTTVLRCLAGLDAVETGRIMIDELVVDDPAQGVFVEPERRPIGLVFQEYLLFAHMTVLENVAYGLRARKTPKDVARRAAREWIDRLGLSEYAAERPRALSGGQAQRAALARALATHPRVLLLDEPLAALDAGTRSAVRRDLRRHLGSFDGMRMLVTHDPVDAYALADRVAILDRGRVVQVGTLAEVTAHPKSRYVAELVGLNLVSGNVRDGVLVTGAGANVVIADAPSGAAFAVIRPHSIALERHHSPGSSVRNVWRGTVAEVDRLGDRVRVGVDGIIP